MDIRLPDFERERPCGACSAIRMFGLHGLIGAQKTVA
jgi:hypothetical protein